MTMKQLYSKIATLEELAEGLIQKFDEKQSEIEENAYEKGVYYKFKRDMTDSEAEKYDLLEEKIESLLNCVDNLKHARKAIEDWA